MILLAAVALVVSTSGLPALEDGDLVFHTSKSTQSLAVGLATGSKWTHMGIVYLGADGKPSVYEAVQPVKTTPWDAWVARGDQGKVVVKRLKNRASLTPEALAKMKALGRTFTGRPYDLQFKWDDERMYCSEIVYKLYERGAGITIGTLQKAREFDLSSPAVQRKMKERFGKTKGAFDPEEPVISPQSMFEDEKLETVFEN